MIVLFKLDKMFTLLSLNMDIKDSILLFKLISKILKK